MAGPTVRNMISTLVLFLFVAARYGTAHRLIEHLTMEVAAPTSTFLQCDQLCYTKSADVPCSYSMLATASHAAKALFAWDDKTTDMNNHLKELLYDTEGGSGPIQWFCGDLCKAPPKHLVPGYCVAREGAEALMRAAAKLADAGSKEAPTMSMHWIHSMISNTTNDVDTPGAGKSIVGAVVEAKPPMSEYEKYAAMAKMPMVIEKAKSGEDGKFIAHLGEDGKGDEVEVDISDVVVNAERTDALQLTAIRQAAETILECREHEKGTEKRDACCVFSARGCQRKLAGLGTRVIASCVAECSQYEKETK